MDTAAGVLRSRGRPLEGDPGGPGEGRGHGQERAGVHGHDGHGTERGHDHTASHEHTPAHEHDQCVETGSVLVDVGDGRGALVLYLDESFRGREVEISRGEERRVHTGVLERSTSRGTVLAAVFGSIAEGSYIVWRDATSPGGMVEVCDGKVTEIHGLGTETARGDRA